MDVRPIKTAQTPEEISKKRAAAGRAKRGTRSLKVLTRIKLEQAANDIVIAKAEKMVVAQIGNALGQRFVYRIDEEFSDRGKVISRKHVLVNDPDEIEIALDAIDADGVSQDEKYYFITTKEPDTKAFDVLMSRAFGKPKENKTIDVKHSFNLTGLARERAKLPPATLPAITDSRPIDASFTELQAPPSAI